MEIIYQGGKHIEIHLGDAILNYEYGHSQCIQRDGYSILYCCDLLYISEVVDFDVIFIYITTTTSIEDILGYIARYTSKYVIPMYDTLSLEMNTRLQDFARRVMLDGYGVPKVLKIGQMIVLS